MSQFRWILPALLGVLATAAPVAVAQEAAEAEAPTAQASEQVDAPAEPEAEETEGTPFSDPLGLSDDKAQVEEKSEDAPLSDPLGLSLDDDENPGQDALNQATDLKLSASDLKDINQVIDLLDEAIETGLDPANTEFAERMLAATLLQRAQALGGLVLRNPMPNPQTDPSGLRWLQIRTKALGDLLRVVALDRKNFDAWVLLGRLQSLSRGDASEARRALSSAIRLAEASANDPDAETIDTTILAQAYALRGAAQKDHASRLRDFNRAAELDPEKAEYLLLRAQAHRAAGDANACLADIDAAAEIAPDNAKVFELRGLALSMQDRKEEAIEAFDRASELAPQAIKPYQYRGELYSQLGEFDKAIAQLDRALEVQPNNLASLLIRTQLLLVNEEPQRALEDAEAILGLQAPVKVQLEAHQMKARALGRLGRTEDAIAWLERLVAIDPKQAALQMQLGVFYADKKMALEAVETFTKVLEIAPDNTLALRLRGDMHLYAGQHAEALADFDAALGVDPNQPGVLNNYAWTLATSPFESIRDGQKAIELATKACELTQNKAAHILSTLGAAYAEAGDFERAIESSEKAVARAKEGTAEDEYDGQLEAELASYRSGQPWRELQKLDVSGPADETAEALKDVTLDSLSDLPIEQPEEGPKVLPGTSVPEPGSPEIKPLKLDAPGSIDF